MKERKWIVRFLVVVFILFFALFWVSAHQEHRFSTAIGTLEFFHEDYQYLSEVTKVVDTEHFVCVLYKCRNTVKIYEKDGTYYCSIFFAYECKNGIPEIYADDQYLYIVYAA